MASPTMGDLAPRDRPRERVVRLGPGALSDSELVGLLLGSGTRGTNAVDLARDLLVAHGGLDGLARLDVAALTRVSGVGPAKATKVVAALELGRRRWVDTGERAIVRTSDDVARLTAPLLADRDRERVVAVVCDRRGRVLAVTVIADGSAHGASFPVREVLAEVLRRDGAVVALAHQHPSGDPTPSAADVAATRALTAAAAQCGVRFLDHVVIGDGRWRSIAAVIAADDVSAPGQPAD